MCCFQKKLLKFFLLYAENNEVLQY